MIVAGGRNREAGRGRAAAEAEELRRRSGSAGSVSDGEIGEVGSGESVAGTDRDAGGDRDMAAAATRELCGSGMSFDCMEWCEAGGQG